MTWRSAAQIQLLQNDLLPLVEATEDLRLNAIRNAKLYTELLLAVFGFGVGNLNGSFAFFVINQRRFRNHQDVFLLFEEDFSVGAHVGLELAAGIGNRHAHLKGGDVVLLLAERRNLCDLAGEFLILERLHNDARGLAQKDFADVGFIDFSLDVNLADVAERHNQSRLRAEYQNRADRVADIHVARKDEPVNRTHNRGVAQIFLRVFQRSSGLRHLRFTFGNLRL